MPKPKTKPANVPFYGKLWPPGTTQRDADLWCFIHGHSKRQGGLGRYQHFRNWTAPIWPEVEWTPWTEDVVRDIFDDSNAIAGAINPETGKPGYKRTVAFTGCAAASKTFSTGLAAVGYWRAMPEDSAVILCTTEKEALRMRVWPVITSLHASALDPDTGEPATVGKLQDSRTRITYQKGDDKHGIFGVAVKRGEISNAVACIKGIHAARVMLIVDEAEVVPPAIWELIPNVRKGAWLDFTLVVVGNSLSKLDGHGMICEPADGWQSITVADVQWQTKGVAKWQIEPGTCRHFRGVNSPNVVAKRTLYPYLYSWEDHLAAHKEPAPGEVPYSQTTSYWSHDEGFWAPAGLKDTLFEEAMFEKQDAYGQFEFLTRSERVAFLDPAFGGDACVFVVGTLGDIVGQKDGLQIQRRVEINVSATENTERDYQIARQVIELCKSEGVAPDHFGCDATGTGRGVHAIIAGEWSSDICRVEFGGAATKRASSTADARPAIEIYANFVTELWYTLRDFLQAGQIKGFYPEAVIQLCARPYLMKGRRYQVVPKDECKALMKGRSPDDADAIAGLVEVCRRLGWEAVTPIADKSGESWAQRVEEANTISAPSNTLDEANKEPDLFETDFAEAEPCDLSL